MTEVKTLDGQPAIARKLTATEARVVVGRDRRIISIEEWRALPSWSTAAPRDTKSREA